MDNNNTQPITEVSTEKLEAIAYKLSRQLNDVRNQLLLIEQEINKRYQEAVKPE